MSAALGHNVRVHSETPTPSGSDLRRAAWRQIRPPGRVERIEPTSGWDTGVAIVDGAIDEGAGVLLLIDASEPGSAARALCALYTGGDATTVTSRDLPDRAWMVHCSNIRDEMARLRPGMGEPASLIGGFPALAATTAAILRAAARRTPVVIAGVMPLIAALIAQRTSGQSTAWVFVGFAHDDAAAQAALARLTLEPWATVHWSAGPQAMESLLRVLVEDLDGTEPA